MKIVFLTQYYFKGGTFFRWHNLAIQLQKMGHQIEIFSCDTNYKSKRRVETVDNIKYNIIPGVIGSRWFGNASNNLFSALKILFIKLPKADIYHLFQPFSVMGFKWLLEKKKRPNAKCFYDWDDLWVGGLIGSKRNHNYIDYQLVNFFEHYLPRVAYGVTTCSSFLENLLKQRNAKRTTILHNGFDTPITTTKEDARKHLGLREDIIYLGFMGRTINELDWCIDTIKNISNPNIFLLLCGLSQKVFQSYMREELKDRVINLGEISPTEAEIFAAAIDFGLLPLEDNDFNNSRFPIKFSEYQRGGSPVFYSDIGELHFYTNKLPWNYPLKPGKDSFINGISILFKDFTHNKGHVDYELLGHYLSWNSKAQELLNFYTAK